MKANELMIGDWVKYGREYFQVDGYFRITNTLCLKYNGKSAYYRDGEIVAEDSDPIPLTAEILEKNGWSKEWVNGGWRYNHKSEFLLSRIKESFYLPVTNHGVYIHYVHELQHALRLCKLDELADNFKI